MKIAPDVGYWVMQNLDTYVSVLENFVKLGEHDLTDMKNKLSTLTNNGPEGVRHDYERYRKRNH